MIEFLYFILFMAAWVTFVKISLYIYDRICYNIIGYIIANAKAEKIQRKITEIISINRSINVY